MIIIFVYDTHLKRESDDLSSAILYFHPHWVSDQQRTALCGQIMGTFHCLKTIFAAPGIISLQSGKFFVREYGRYILVNLRYPAALEQGIKTVFLRQSGLTGT